MKKSRCESKRRSAARDTLCLVAYGVGVAVTSLAMGAEPPVPGQWRPVGQLDPDQVREASGIVKSRRYPGIFWTHGDSANQPELYAFRESGEVICTVRLAKAPNTDWEDIAADAAGNLYVGDIGNNKGIFGTRYIYVLPEPDPHTAPTATARWTRRMKFKYPEKRFNAECLFVLKDRVYITSSDLRERPVVYRVDPTSETECTLVQIETLPVWLAQGADVSLDETKLVVCTSGAFWVVDIDENAHPVPNRKPVRVTFPPSSAEACCFDGGDVLVLNEKGQIYRVARADIRAGMSFRRPPKAPESVPRPPTSAAARKEHSDAGS